MPDAIRSQKVQRQIGYINKTLGSYGQLKKEVGIAKEDIHQLLDEVKTLKRERDCKVLSKDFYTTVNCINAIMQKNLSGSINFIYQKNIPVKQVAYMHIQHAFGLINFYKADHEITKDADETMLIVNRFRAMKDIKQSNIFNDYTLSLIVREYFKQNEGNHI